MGNHAAISLGGFQAGVAPAGEGMHHIQPARFVSTRRNASLRQTDSGFGLLFTPSSLIPRTPDIAPLPLNKLVCKRNYCRSHL